MGSLASKLAGSWRIDGTFGKSVEAELSKIPVDTLTDEKFLKLKEKRAFTGGYRAGRVVLLENDVVRKFYDMKHESTRRFFWHEIGMLSKLKGCPYTTQLLHFDKARGYIYLSYCGESVTNTAAVQVTLKSHMREIKRKWGVEHNGIMHPRFGRGTTYGKPLNNVTQKDGNVYLIDFGGDAWYLSPPKKNPIPKPAKK